MLFQVDYEGVKISFCFVLIFVFHSQNGVLGLLPAPPASACDRQPSRSGVLTQTQNSICKHFWNISNFRIHSSPGPAFFTLGLSNAIRKSILYKKCKVLFSYNIPRKSVMISVKGERWFMAAHSAPLEVSKAEVESFHAAIGTRALESCSDCKSRPFTFLRLVMDVSPRGPWFTGKIWHLINILNPDMFSY